MTPTERAHADARAAFVARDKLIFSAYLSGARLADIARRANVSVARVSQICAKMKHRAVRAAVYPGAFPEYAMLGHD